MVCQCAVIMAGAAHIRRAASAIALKHSRSASSKCKSASRKCAGMPAKADADARSFAVPCAILARAAVRCTPAVRFAGSVPVITTKRGAHDAQRHPLPRHQCLRAGFSKSAERTGFAGSKRGSAWTLSQAPPAAGICLALAYPHLGFRLRARGGRSEGCTPLLVASADTRRDKSPGGRCRGIAQRNHAGLLHRVRTLRTPRRHTLPARASL